MARRAGDLPDEPLEPSLLAAAREYHRPPETPREAMWRAIQAERRVGARHCGPAPRRWLPWAAAAAALLAVGVGIGRLTQPARHGPRRAGRQLGSLGRVAAGERDRLPPRHDRASGPVGGVPDAVPRLGPGRAGRSGSPRRPRASCSPPTGCCSTRRRRRTGRRGCCSRISSWCWPRSRSSPPTRSRTTAS